MSFRSLYLRDRMTSPLSSSPDLRSVIVWTRIRCLEKEKRKRSSNYVYVVGVLFQNQPWARTDSYTAAAGGSQYEARDHGLFVLRAMVKMDYPPEKIVGVLRNLLENKINRQCVAR